MAKHSRKVSTPKRPMMPQLILASSLVVLTLVLFPLASKWRSGGDELVRLTNRGKFHYDKGEAAQAIDAFGKAVKLNPVNSDALLNLANAYLLDNQTSNTLRLAREVLDLDASSAAAHYLRGCAYLRERQYEPALKALQQAKDIDPAVDMVTFQLARAHQELNHLENAIAELEELVGFVPEHPVAHYSLSQLYARNERPEDAQQELELHLQIQAKRSSAPSDLATFERCVYTEIRVPFKLEQPDRSGVAVVFKDATQAFFGSEGRDYQGPVGIVDLKHDGWNSLFVREGPDAFRLLVNSNGAFQPFGPKHPAVPGADYRRCLVAELHEDRFEDIIVLGEKASHVFKFATNAVITEATRYAGLKEAFAADGALVDFDFTGKLDLLALEPEGGQVRSFRNLGSFFFKENTEATGLPDSLPGATQIVLDDWNNDDLPDVFLARENQPPLLLTKTRGGPLTSTNSPPDWPSGGVIAVGDLNNDLRTDLVVGNQERLAIVFNGLTEPQTIALDPAFALRKLLLTDYDNDGWLDIFATGSQGLKAWRNLGTPGFRDVSQDLGLSLHDQSAVESLVAADFDRDGDSDLLLSLAADQGIRLLRNEGGNANHQLKVRLLGNRSNPSGFGIRLELTAGGLRASRTVSRLPIEIGVGQHAQVDSMTVRWFDLAVNSVEIKVEPDRLYTFEEIQLPTGSCPYLYAWDGRQFRFVTDILSASPAGLPVAEGRYVEADPDEYAWIGNETMFQPKEGQYVLQITEELREVMYLDVAKLVIVDHPEGTEAHPTSKMMPGRPFPQHEIVTLHQRRPLLKAVNHETRDVTELLQTTDGRLVSPPALRAPQLRGLAEPSSVTLDFGPLPPDRPLVLALTGWLRFGGGMANVAASHHPELPWPFPILEAETSDNSWKRLEVEPGVPAGKTKTILINLAGKLSPSVRRLRLSTAFELHWDRIALFEKQAKPETRITEILPTETDLHWRGFSEFADLPWYVPLTPLYDQVNPQPNWRITPSGWCARYGRVDELLAEKDNALVLISGGDELTLRFSDRSIPATPAGDSRDFFLFSVGWDKDADFHVAAGTTIEPIPWHGMDDQSYGRQVRPSFPNDAWIKQYNTRWVGPRTLVRRGIAR